MRRAVVTPRIRSEAPRCSLVLRAVTFPEQRLRAELRGSRPQTGVSGECGVAVRCRGEPGAARGINSHKGRQSSTRRMLSSDWVRESLVPTSGLR